MIKTDERFDSALYALGAPFDRLLLGLPRQIKEQTAEIRLRAERPLMLTVASEPVWITSDGVSYLPPASPVRVSKWELREIFLRLCESSVYSHEEELKQGYIVLKHGHRAGVCGTLAPGGGVREVSSINIRIARQIKGCADLAAREFDKGGMLIAGPPGSGKTTMLRDLIRQLAQNRGMRIAVIDTRGEIAACCGAVPSNELGDTVDVLNGYEKAAGIEMAVRTLNPQIVAFDELGDDSETAAVASALCAGAAVIATVHAGNEREMFSRRRVQTLLSDGAVSKIVMLSGKAGAPVKIIKDGWL